MSERMHRTQILLEPEQHRQLAAMAEQERRSVSDLVREMIAAQLTVRQQDQALARERRLRVLEHIAKRKQAMVEKRSGQLLSVDAIALIDELREERDDDLFSAARPNRN